MFLERLQIVTAHTVFVADQPSKSTSKNPCQVTSWGSVATALLDTSSSLLNLEPKDALAVLRIQAWSNPPKSSQLERLATSTSSPVLDKLHAQQVIHRRGWIEVREQQLALLKQQSFKRHAHLEIRLGWFMIEVGLKTAQRNFDGEAATLAIYIYIICISICWASQIQWHISTSHDQHGLPLPFRFAKTPEVSNHRRHGWSPCSEGTPRRSRSLLHLLLVWDPKFWTFKIKTMLR